LSIKDKAKRSSRTDYFSQPQKKKTEKGEAKRKKKKHGKFLSSLLNIKFACFIIRRDPLPGYSFLAFASLTTVVSSYSTQVVDLSTAPPVGHVRF
jgi:hypothetical protein